MRPYASKLLPVIQIFIALTAVIGGIMLITTGAGMPLSFLQASPFTSFVIPGLILGLVVGGTHALAAYLTIARHPWAPAAGAVAGFGMLIWTYGEVFFVLHTHWLQNLYFGLGITELVIVLLMLNLLPHRSPS